MTCILISHPPHAFQQKLTSLHYIMKLGLVLILLLVSYSTASYTLPDICLCNVAAQSDAPELLSCSLRRVKADKFSDCAALINIENSVEIASGEGNLTCTCLTKFVPFSDLTGFVQTIFQNATYAVLYNQLNTTRFIDEFVELEFLYEESAELLLSYKSKDKMLFGTTLRRSKVSPGNQNFWYGFDASAEALWVQ